MQQKNGYSETNVTILYRSMDFVPLAKFWVPESSAYVGFEGLIRAVNTMGGRGVQRFFGLCLFSSKDNEAPKKRWCI